MIDAVNPRKVPELPEVEVTRRAGAIIEQQTVESVIVREPRLHGRYRLGCLRCSQAAPLSGCVGAESICCGNFYTAR